MSKIKIIKIVHSALTGTNYARPRARNTKLCFVGYQHSKARTTSECYSWWFAHPHSRPTESRWCINPTTAKRYSSQVTLLLLKHIIWFFHTSMFLTSKQKFSLKSTMLSKKKLYVAGYPRTKCTELKKKKESSVLIELNPNIFKKQSCILT